MFSLSVIVTVVATVATSAVPVTFPVRGPAKASEVTVPSKKASLNSREAVPRSRPALPVGCNEVASRVSSVVLFILKSISSFVPKSIAVSESSPMIRSVA